MVLMADADFTPRGEILPRLTRSPGGTIPTGGEVDMSGAIRSRVLLVEDDLELAGLAAASLRDFGCDVFHAADLRAARGHLQAGRWSAIILDAQLPDGDGFDLCKDLSSRKCT